MHERFPKHSRMKQLSLVYTGLLVLWLVSLSRTGFSLCTCSCTAGKKRLISIAKGKVEHSRMGVFPKKFPNIRAWEKFPNTRAWEQEE